MADPLSNRRTRVAVKTWLKERKWDPCSCVGKGSFGEAYRVLNMVDGCEAVAKVQDYGAVAKRDKEEVQAARKKAELEARMLKAVHHPNVVQFIDVFFDSTRMCIVMAMCAGGDLEGRIKLYRESRSRLEEWRILQWGASILSALRFVHARKLIHRDLKSSNFFLSYAGGLHERVQLGDFGIARTFDKTDQLAHTRIGTPYYLAPELCREKPYNSAADIWAAGCVLYEMCQLTVPFLGDDMRQLLDRIANSTPLAVSSTYSNQLANLIMCCLRKTPLSRPSARKLLNTKSMRLGVQLLATRLLSGVPEPSIKQVRLKSVLPTLQLVPDLQIAENAEPTIADRGLFRVMQANSAYAEQSLELCSVVEYYSSSYNGWVRAYIIDTKLGGFRLDVKEQQWFSMDDVPSRVRKFTQPIVRGDACFEQLVTYVSKQLSEDWRETDFGPGPGTTAQQHKEYANISIRAPKVALDKTGMLFQKNCVIEGPKKSGILSGIQISNKAKTPNVITSKNAISSNRTPSDILAKLKPQSSRDSTPGERVINSKVSKPSTSSKESTPSYEAARKKFSVDSGVSVKSTPSRLSRHSSASNTPLSSGEKVSRISRVQSYSEDSSNRAAVGAREALTLLRRRPPASARAEQSYDEVASKESIIEYSALRRVNSKESRDSSGYSYPNSARSLGNRPENPVLNHRVQSKAGEQLLANLKSLSRRASKDPNIPGDQIIKNSDVEYKKENDSQNAKSSNRNNQVIPARSSRRQREEEGKKVKDPLANSDGDHGKKGSSDIYKSISARRLAGAAQQYGPPSARRNAVEARHNAELSARKAAYSSATKHDSAGNNMKSDLANQGKVSNNKVSVNSNVDKNLYPTPMDAGRFLQAVGRGCNTSNESSNSQEDINRIRKIRPAGAARVNALPGVRKHGPGRDVSFSKESENPITRRNELKGVREDWEYAVPSDEVVGDPTTARGNNDAVALRGRSMKAHLNIIEPNNNKRYDDDSWKSPVRSSRHVYDAPCTPVECGSDVASPRTMRRNTSSRRASSPSDRDVITEEYCSRGWSWEAARV